MDVVNDIWLSNGQQIVIALDIAMPVGEFLAPVIFLFQFVPLDHGAHCAIQNENALSRQGIKLLVC